MASGARRQEQEDSVRVFQSTSSKMDDLKYARHFFEDLLETAQRAQADKEVYTGRVHHG